MVADGVGGNNSGELASGETVKCVADYMRRNLISAQIDRRDIRRQMQECVREVNTHVISISREFPENRGMASTLLLCFIKNDLLSFAPSLTAMNALAAPFAFRPPRWLSLLLALT